MTYTGGHMPCAGGLVPLPDVICIHLHFMHVLSSYSSSTILRILGGVPQGDRLTQPQAVRVFRCQLPLHNQWYPAEPPGDDDATPPVLQVGKRWHDFPCMAM